MHSEQVIQSVFRELRRSGHIEAVFRVLLDARETYRKEIDGLLNARLLVTEETRAELYALQGQMKACSEIYATMETLAVDYPTAGNASGDSDT